LGSIYSSAAGVGSENKHPAQRHRAPCAPRTVLRATTRHKPTHPCHRSDGPCPPGGDGCPTWVVSSRGWAPTPSNHNEYRCLPTASSRAEEARSLRSLPRFPSPPSPEGLATSSIRGACGKRPQDSGVPLSCRQVSVRRRGDSIPRPSAEIVELLEENPGMRARTMIRGSRRPGSAATGYRRGGTVLKNDGNVGKDSTPCDLRGG
jgi:hypothetical protein